MVLCVSPVCFPAEIGAIAAETVTGRLATENGYSWRSSYDITFQENSLVVYVAIHVIHTTGVTKLELDGAKRKWEKAIEGTWSHQFAIRTSSGQQYPIIVDAAFKGPRFHHDVIVRPGGGKSDELNWNILDSSAVVAHEFGHMVGAFDEYKGGALDPRSRMIDATSIMTSNPTAGVTYARHYQEFLAWFTGKTRLSDVALILIDGGRRERIHEMQARGERE
jgi:hypothetical protein